MIRMADMSFNKSDRSIDYWLFFVMFLVVAMIVIGGATRLTNSGLSITEWAPIKGALPPLSLDAWESEFLKYQQIPEFTEEHPDMDLDGFKFIYFWEWSHRQLGRIIGLAYALPFFFFWARRRLPIGQELKFFTIMLLIGIQGAIGWWMVASGLTDDRVDVSQYRLATHLGLAFVILGSLLWLWQNQRELWPRNALEKTYKKRTTLLALLVFLQILSGAFVAGLHAGKTYNSWPLMDGDIVPAGYNQLTPVWKNAFENIAAVQFNHRTLAYVILGVAVWVLISTRTHRDIYKYAKLFFGFLIWQVILGICTLIMGDPLWLALLHQFSAIFVFLTVVAMMRAARKRRF